MKSLRSIDEAEQLPALSPAKSDQSSSAAASPPDRARRRLVRGAAAVAPLVLTLRSGGVLAAVSCMGVSQITVTDANGDFMGNSIAVPGDQCVDTFSQNAATCPGNRITGGSLSGVPVTHSGVTGYLRCQGMPNRTVAILSSIAATSLVS